MEKASTNDLRIPNDFTFIRTFHGVDEFVLKNGLTVLLFEEASQGNVTVNITYLVGSRHEGRGEAGMAHLLEHMLFRGTKDRRDVKGALQDRGAHFNATTWYDRTNYYETLTPAEENLAFALRLEADRMVNSLILREDLDSEMTVVRNEFEMGENNPIHVLHDQLMSAAYRWHNYGKTTIGNRSDIERVSIKSLRNFYEHYYQPDNAVLIVAGQFDKQKAIDLIEESFSKLARPNRTLDQTYTEEPAQDGPREVILERVGDVASVAVGYHIPSAHHRDHAALQVLLDVACDEPAGLLYKKLVTSQKCSEIFSMTYALFEPGMALCFVRPTKNDMASSIRDVLISLLEERLVDSLSEDQVERIKTRMLKRIKLSMANSKDLALKLSEAIACGDWRLFFWYKEQIKKVTLANVKRVAQKYVISSNRTSGIFSPKADPDRAHIDQGEKIDVILNELVEDQGFTAGDAFIATVKNIEDSIERENLNPHRKMALLYKRTRGQAVRASFRFRFSNAKDILPHIKEFWLIPPLLMRGTSKYSYQALRDRVDVLMSSLDIDGHDGVLSASIKSEREQIAPMISLLSHILSDPSFDAEEFKIVKQREIDNFQESKSDPQRICFHEMERLKAPWPKDNILYVHEYEEIIEGLKDLELEKVIDAYKRLFAPEHLEVSMVGDFDEDALRSVLKNSFEFVFSRSPYQRIPRPFIENVVKDMTIDTKDKEMAMVAYAFNFAMRDDDEDFPALKLANYMFGENMNSRLMMRIREKEGISYGAGSSIEISRHEQNASINIYAMSAPGSVSRAKRAIEEEWDRVLNSGFTQQELDIARESIWLGFENLLANDGFLVNAMVNDLYVDRDFLFRENLFLRMKDLSPQDLDRALHKWWGLREFSKVCAGDMGKLS